MFTCDPITNLTSLIGFLTCILSQGVVPLLVGVAVAAFIYGIIQYFLNPDNEEKHKAGKSFMVWGIISLFVMISFWGIVKIFQGTFTENAGYNVKMPTLPTQQ